MADVPLSDMQAHPAAEAAGTEANLIALQLLKEGGRGAVLLGAARLDFALEKLLRSVMQPHTGGDDNLFDPDRPLSTFSAKIALSHRLGLVDKLTEHALQMVRRVRNEFAHSFEEASLTDQSHRNRLSKVYQEARKNPLWDCLRPKTAQNAQLSPEFYDFICLVVILVSFMEACAHMALVIRPLASVSLRTGISINVGDT